MENKALNFLFKAYKNQDKKSNNDYLWLLHSLDVANILKEYDFDKNVIIAGYIHDAIPSTEYTTQDIKKIFGDDIFSLIVFGFEEDDEPSGEKEKPIVIDKVAEWDMRHKAVLCADKISNLENIANTMGQKNDIFFGKSVDEIEKEKLYYENVYKNLIFNEDVKFPMFIRFRKLIDIVFYAKKEETFVELNRVCEDKYYVDLLKLYYKSKELFKLKKLIKNVKPYVIEFAGTPRGGKTKLLNNLLDFFVKSGFICDFVEEFTKTKKYKEYYFPKWKNKNIIFVNVKIYENILKKINKSLLKGSSIVLVDRSLIDRLIWINRLYENGKIVEKEYNDLRDKILMKSKHKTNITIATYVDVDIALKRDYDANLSLEKRSFLNRRRIEEYNMALENIEMLAKEKSLNFFKVDTSNMGKREVSIYVANIILDDLKSFYLEEIKKKL